MPALVRRFHVDLLRVASAACPTLTSPPAPSACLPVRGPARLRASCRRACLIRHG